MITRLGKMKQDFEQDAQAHDKELGQLRQEHSKLLHIKDALERKRERERGEMQTLVDQGASALSSALEENSKLTAERDKSWGDLSRSERALDAASSQASHNAATTSRPASSM